MAENDKESVIVDWSIAINKNANTLTIVRISDVPFTSQAQSILEGVIKKEMEVDVTVSDNRIPRTIFQSSDNDVKKLKNDAKNLVNLLNRKDILVDLTMKSKPKTKVWKWSKMNKEISNI